jgi:hypothetical protein
MGHAYRRCLSELVAGSSPARPRFASAAFGASWRCASARHSSRVRSMVLWYDRRARNAMQFRVFRISCRRDVRVALADHDGSGSNMMRRNGFPAMSMIACGSPC